MAKLTGDVQKLSDAELYFIVAKGISNTAMPAFGKHHSPNDMWKAILWIRHLARLTPQEKQEVVNQMRRKTENHEQTMEKGQ